MAEADDLFGTKWFRTLVVATLLGAGAGNYRLSTADMDDRFKGEDFQREMEPRDEKVARMDRKIERIEEYIASHIDHSATHTERIHQNTRALEQVEKEHEEDKRDLINHLRGHK